MDMDGSGEYTLYQLWSWFSSVREIFHHMLLVISYSWDNSSLKIKFFSKKTEKYANFEIYKSLYYLISDVTYLVSTVSKV